MIRLLPKPQNRYSPDLTINEDYRKERETLIAYDIHYFIECLGLDRNIKYQDLGDPDAINRNDRSPDRLILNQSTGDQVAIEYADLRESQEATRQLAYELKKVGWSSGTGYPTPKELALRLLELMDEKKRKDQFINYPDAEKILLFRNRWAFYKDIIIFKKCFQYLELPEEKWCDHCYILLLTGDTIEIF